MPEVFLELLGDEFDVTAALANSSLREYANVQKRGEIVLGSRRCDTSGLRIWVGGDDEAGLEIQIAEALAFLREDGEEVRRMCNLAGVQTARLRFGEDWPANIIVHCPHFPSELLLACGELGLDIAINQYLQSE